MTTQPEVQALGERFNFAEHLIKRNAGRVSKAAYVDDQGRMSFGELAEQIQRAAAALLASGVCREERALLLMHDCSDWPVAFLGAMYAGIVPVAVNTLLTVDDYAYMLRNSRSQAVMVSGALLPTLREAMTAIQRVRPPPGRGAARQPETSLARPKRTEGARHPEADGTSFDFLGLTHVWGRSRNGKDMVRQVTAKSRFARAVAAVNDWCRRNRHWSLRDQHRHLSSMMRGHFAYYGVGGNSRRLRWFANQAVRAWHKWLSRRDRQCAVPWARFNELLARHPLPSVKIIHGYAAASEALS